MVSYFSNETVTISVYFYPTGSGVIVDELGQSSLNTARHDSQIEILSTGEVKVGVRHLTPVSLGTVIFNQWQNVVLRYNKATLTLDGFLNGVKALTNVRGDRNAPWEYGHGLHYAFGPTD